MARRKRQWGRKLNAILQFDKPHGITSNGALQEVKRLFKAAKAGHTGNLDPLATGLLPICFGEATKLSAFLLDADKHYRGICKLGKRTTTADGEGDVIDSRPIGDISEQRVLEVLEQFRGDLMQVPPMHSAIKYQGQPLYKLAHQGIEVERQPRAISIHDIRLERFDGDELEISVHCSKGTYIRTLAEDIGEALGCGAYLSKLNRTGVGPFDSTNMVTLEQVRAAAEEGEDALDALLLPMEAALCDWPRVELSDNSLYYVRQGQPVIVSQAPTQGLVGLFSQQQMLVGVGYILDDGRVAPKRLLGGG